MSESLEDQVPSIVAVIPGPWEDRAAVLAAMRAAEHERFEVIDDQEAGMMGLVDREWPWGAVIELRPRQAGLEKMAEVVGFGRLKPRDLGRVAEHRSIVVLTGEGGTAERALSMMRAADLLCRAGGRCVMIETTGGAHTPEGWAALTKGASEGVFQAVMLAFVVCIGGQKRGLNGFYTCGMHNMGLRDALTEAVRDPEQAAMVLMSFLEYTFHTKETIGDGDPIGGEEEGPMFRVFREPCRLYEEEDLFFNPYGMWRIVPV